ncbi:hypothetical protein AB836_00675 [Rickettsiales bacterium (ex Bugula neritina AB1)]|nr:hypothetical protein AB836_00675 [Rickettsiales bacterium (ex Bugula neritina AB1)]
MFIVETQKIIKAELVIIGGGIAASSAAVYYGRGASDDKKKQSYLITGMFGGQITQTNSLENYLGFKGTGMEFSDLIYKQVEENFINSNIIHDMVTEVDFSKENQYLIKLSNGNVYKSRSVIIATGAHHRDLKIPLIEKYRDRGIYYCAVCDGSLFKNKQVMVIGGGNSAFTEALYLSNICEKVYLVHRGEDFPRVESLLKEQVFAKKNIHIIKNANLKELKGDSLLKSVVIHYKNNFQEEIQVSAVFIAIGFIPNTRIFENYILTQDGYIFINENQEVFDKNKKILKGIYSAGDVDDSKYRQGITAAAEGCKAVLNLLKYLRTIDN